MVWLVQLSGWMRDWLWIPNSNLHRTLLQRKTLRGIKYKHSKLRSQEVSRWKAFFWTLNFGLIWLTSLQAYKFTNLQAYKFTSLRVYKFTSLRVYKFTSLQVYEFTSLQFYKLTSLQAFKFTSLQFILCHVAGFYKLLFLIYRLLLFSFWFSSNNVLFDLSRLG